jgi:uncharacterized membrane protein YccF (DUF307 family)
MRLILNLIWLVLAGFWLAILYVLAGLVAFVLIIIWIIVFGWWLAIGHLVSGIALCLTIIGIPLGLADFKIIPITLVPLGVRIVPVDQGPFGGPAR